MPRYKYTATTDGGKTVRGTASAATPEALYEQMRVSGKYVTEQHEVGDAAVKTALKTAQVAEYCRNLGTLLSAGVPLIRAFSILSEEKGTPPQVRAIYDRIQGELRKGIPLSDAMEGCGPAFPPLLISMIRSAEGTGNIDKSALRMADHYEKEHKLNQEVGNAMMYPIILMVLLVLVVVVLMAFVVPQFSDMFAQMESLPLPTTILLGISDFMSTHWFAVVLGLVVLVVVLRLLFAIPQVKLRVDWIKLHAPIVGKLNRKICTARFARTLSNLYSSGVPIVGALASARNTVGNTWIASQFDTVLTTVRSGGTLSAAIGAVDGFESKLASSVAVGEETGKLDTLLATMSTSMDYEAENANKRLLTLIEPVMILLIALVVGFVIIAVILPIYQSYGTIGGSAGAI